MSIGCFSPQLYFWRISVFGHNAICFSCRPQISPCGQCKCRKSMGGGKLFLDLFHNSKCFFPCIRICNQCSLGIYLFFVPSIMSVSFRFLLLWQKYLIKSSCQIFYLQDFASHSKKYQIKGWWYYFCYILRDQQISRPAKSPIKIFYLILGRTKLKIIMR